MYHNPHMAGVITAAAISGSSLTWANLNTLVIVVAIGVLTMAALALARILPKPSKLR